VGRYDGDTHAGHDRLFDGFVTAELESRFRQPLDAGKQLVGDRARTGALFAQQESLLFQLG
jgi:hypothetical protein